MGLFAAIDFCCGATIGVYVDADVTPSTVGLYVQPSTQTQGPPGVIEGAHRHARQPVYCAK